MMYTADSLTLLTTPEVVELIELHNQAYRAGNPIISDDEYDNVLIAELVRRDPNHPWLSKVEPEPVTGKTVKLPEKMLSTQKAYTLKELKKWYADAVDTGSHLGTGLPIIRIGPKLDGFSAYDANDFQATRGDGVNGTDITHAFKRGLNIYQNGRKTPNEGWRNGEIVVDVAYFEEHLSETYANTRNVVAAVIKEGEWEPLIKAAVEGEFVMFVPFQNLLWFNPPAEQFENYLREDGLDHLWATMLSEFEYSTDGLIFEVVNPYLRDYLGSTNHHHKWQIAYKRNTEYHEIEVIGVTPQTAKTGRITPVVNLTPTQVSGVTISNATGHHYGNILDKRIGVGAVVKVCRSGQVIPYIAGVITPAKMVHVPDQCPSCGSKAELRVDNETVNLYCTNTLDCPAQIENTIRYFFDTIGCCDGFGPKIIEKLVAAGIVKASHIYDLGIHNLENVGISSGVAFNLYKELQRSMATAIEDWRFLAAFSIPGVGKGGSEKLLTKFTLNELFHLTKEDVLEVEGFGDILADSLLDSLARIKEDFLYLRPKFNLSSTRAKVKANGPLTGKLVVFTGTMQKGSREDMITHAKTLGAKIGTSVSSKTHYLICGEGVGKNKTEAAAKHGTQVLTEQAYLDLIA